MTRLHSIVLLAVTVLLACVDSTTATTASKKMAVDYPAVFHTFADTGNNMDTPSQQVVEDLRNNRPNNEERAGLMDLIKSGTSKVVDYAKLQKYLFTNKDGVQVLSKLQFGDDVAAVLKSKRFDKLRKHVTMFNEKNPNKQISMIGTLTTRYGDDAVAKALVTAKQPDSTKAIATKLQTQQLQGWFDNTKSVDDVFKILKLSDVGPTVIMGRKLETLDSYVKLFNSKQSNVKDTTNSFRILRKGFGGDSKFVFVVSSALAAPATETMYTTAFKYQNKLFKRWLNSELDPTKVLTKVFKVDKVADGTWVGSFVKRYTTYYNKEMGQPVGF